MNKIKDIFIFLLLFAIFLTLSTYTLYTSIDFSYPIIKMLQILGYEFTSNSYFVSNTNIIINNYCSGLFSIGLFITIMISPITKTANKFRKVVFGSLILYAINFIRILVIIEFAQIIDANTLHLIGWVFMSISIMVLWLIMSKGNR